MNITSEKIGLPRSTNKKKVDLINLIGYFIIASFALMAIVTIIDEMW